MTDLLPQRWARPSLDADANALLGSVERGLSVKLIATPRDRLECAGVDNDLRTVATRNEVQRFDFLPVTQTGESGAPVRGLLRMTPYLNREREPEGAVRDHMEPLSEENLIGADAGLLTFVRDADSRPCRLVFAGTEIVGLVTLSDIQRLPVRPVLFMLITHLELLMADAIRAEFGASVDWKERLSNGRRKQLEDRIVGRQHAGMELDQILMTEFCDKATIIGKRSDLPVDRKTFGRAMARAQELRDAVAHANDFAATPKAAKQTCATVRSIEEWITLLRQPPFVPGTEPPDQS
jgi:hypothetical protein